MDIKTLVHEYISAFQAKDLKKLDRLYSHSVWLDEFGDNLIFGKVQVLDANETLFRKGNLTVGIVSEAYTDDVAAVELHIMLDSNTKEDSFTIDVVDIITMENGLIKSIVAYKGRYSSFSSDVEG